MKSDMLVCFVVYPGIEQWKDNFIKSINQQVETDFDILILEDGIDSNTYKQGLLKVKIFTILCKNGKPIENREVGLMYGIQHDYKFIVYFDADDVYNKERLSTLKKYLQDYDVVVHDMNIIDGDGKLLSTNFFKDVPIYTEFGYENILRHNFCGLGNTGFKLSRVKEYKRVRNDIVAFDWWLSLQILLKGGEGIIIPDVLSSYRRYDGNSVSLNTIEEKDINNEYEVKNKLYSEILLKLNVDKTQSVEVMSALQILLENKYENVVNKQRNVWWDILS